MNLFRKILTFLGFKQKQKSISINKLKRGDVVKVMEYDNSDKGILQIKTINKINYGRDSISLLYKNNSTSIYKLNGKPYYNNEKADDILEIL